MTEPSTAQQEIVSVGDDHKTHAWGRWRLRVRGKRSYLTCAPMNDSEKVALVRRICKEAIRDADSRIDSEVPLPVRAVLALDVEVNAISILEVVGD